MIMSTFIRCDGCGTELLYAAQLVLTIERSNGSGGGGVPIDPGKPGHLCLACSRIAFNALKQAQIEREL